MPLTVVTISKEMGWDKTQSVSMAFSSLTHDVEPQTIKAWSGIFRYFSVLLDP